MRNHKKRVPKVRLARPAGRPYQLRYTCPERQREVRVSTNTRNEAEALEQKRLLEARLLLGINAPRQSGTMVRGPQMPWDEFRQQYSANGLSMVRDGSVVHSESRLDIAERILSPRTLADVANVEALHALQTKLLAGVEGRYARPRSPHTVKTYMAAVMATLNWARFQGWLESTPMIRKVKVSKLRAMKGRPITAEEFERMLAKVPTVVGSEAAESWQYLLRGLWESALRINEAMHLSWDLPNTIRPEWKRGRLPVLHIPAALQKNATEEAIPLLPGFEALLLETPESQRTGWVFEPVSLNVRWKRPVRYQRPDAEWCGKIITRIGKAAGVIVIPPDEHTGRPAKYASAHDLRQSCAERLLDAGLPPLVIGRVMRHASFETTRRHYAPGSVQQEAGLVRKYLGTVDRMIDVTQYTRQDLNL